MSSDISIGPEENHTWNLSLNQGFIVIEKDLPTMLFLEYLNLLLSVHRKRIEGFLNFFAFLKQYCQLSEAWQ